MSCLNPLIAIYAINEDGIKYPRVVGQVTSKTDLEFFRKMYGNNLVFLPCGKCPSCLKDYSRLWQVRIMCESLYHPHSYFLTLTYAKNPPDKPLKGHLRNFIKSIRNYFGSGIKFFGSGELGENTSRSHYHLILFGAEIKDLQVISKRGLNYIYASKTIEKLWNKGFVSIGEVDIESAGYVAQYSQKKRLDFNLKKDSSFIIMSRGLGLKYVYDHHDELLTSDYIYIKGNKFKLPRYFIDKLANFHPDRVSFYKSKKERVAKSFRFNEGYSTNENNARILKRDIEVNKLRKEVSTRELD